MIVGLGTDIVSIERIAKVWQTKGDNFVAHICREDEKIYVQQKQNQVLQLAKIWAVKEAAVKALGTGFSQGIGFQDIALKHNAEGKPELEFFGRAQEILALRMAGDCCQVHVSLSDDKPFAQAVVIIEKYSC